jgi:hypothetical protein
MDSRAENRGYLKTLFSCLQIIRRITNTTHENVGAKINVWPVIYLAFNRAVFFIFFILISFVMDGWFLNWNQVWRFQFLIYCYMQISEIMSWKHLLVKLCIWIPFPMMKSLNIFLHLMACQTLQYLIFSICIWSFSIVLYDFQLVLYTFSFVFCIVHFPFELYNFLFVLYNFHLYSIMFHLYLIIFYLYSIFSICIVYFCICVV